MGLPYNDKTFKVTVNVYANAKIVTESDIALEKSTNISSITVDGVEATAVSEQNYDYEVTLPSGTTSTTINVETESPYATVNVEKLDGLVYSSNIKRLSTSKTLDLNPGDNYFKVTVTSENKDKKEEYKIKINVEKELEGFAKIIYNANPLVTTQPTLTTSSNNTSDESGLYKSTATNFNGVEGLPTYYFRGNVENNYVSFAGFTWRVVRINEDGTIRMIMANGINDNNQYIYNSTSSMYYSNSNAKTQLETWYTNNIASNEKYASKVATGNYFCEQAKVIFSKSNSAGNATMELYSSYTPNFKCSTD